MRHEAFTNHISTERGAGVQGVANYTTTGSAYIGFFYFLLFSILLFNFYSIRLPPRAIRDFFEDAGLKGIPDTTTFHRVLRITSWRGGLEEEPTNSFFFVDSCSYLRGERYIAKDRDL